MRGYIPSVFGRLKAASRANVVVRENVPHAVHLVDSTSFKHSALGRCIDVVSPWSARAWHARD
jgi:hypothetical protein